MKKEVLLYFALLNIMVFGNNTQPQIAMNSNGDAAIVWSQFNGLNSVVYESTRLKGDSDWADPIQVSLDHRDAFFHQLAMNEAGKICFIWQSYNGSFFEIQVAAADFGAPPSAPETISTRSSFFPKIAIDDDGDGIAVWQETFPTGKILTASHIAYGIWTSSSQLDGYGDYFIVPNIAVEPGLSSAIAVWQRSINKDRIGIAAALFDGTSWDHLVSLSSPETDAINPQVVYSSSGEAVAVWQTNFQEKLAIQVASYVNGVWQPPVTINDTAAHLADPQVTINASGQIVIVGRRFNEIHSSIVAIIRDSGAWREFTVLSEESSCKNPRVDLNDSGQAIAVWSCTRNANKIIQAATLIIGEDWSDAVDLISTENNLNPQVAIDSTGYGIATWQAGTNVKAAILPSFGGAWNPPENVNTIL